MERSNLMSHKNTPIVKKKLVELLKELPVIERLNILEPLCEVYRAESRQEVEKDVREWTKKKGLPRIKTDY
jgi:hypothetical protein